MAKIVGKVYWIKGKKKTATVVSAREAFSDPDQAVKQVLYGGEPELARLAYKQYQGKRYRTQKKPRKKANIKKRIIVIMIVLSVLVVALWTRFGIGWATSGDPVPHRFALIMAGCALASVGGIWLVYGVFAWIVKTLKQDSGFPR